MEKEEICRKFVDFGGIEEWSVVYSLVAEYCKAAKKTTYGVSVEIPERGEMVCLSDITTHKAEAEHLLDLLATGFVTPVTVKDVVEDWLGR